MIDTCNIEEGDLIFLEEKIMATHAFHHLYLILKIYKKEDDHTLTAKILYITKGRKGILTSDFHFSDHDRSYPTYKWTLYKKKNTMSAH